MASEASDDPSGGSQQSRPAATPSGEALGTEFAGRVTRVLFRDEGALFAAVLIRPSDGGREIRAVGEFWAVSVGDEFTLAGRWETHPKWGLELRLERVVWRAPRQPEAIVAYLSGGLFRGLGPTLARRLVNHFGADTLEVIHSHPQRLSEVAGIGPKKRKRLLAALVEHRRIEELALFLQGHGVSLLLTKKLHERYGDEALAIVRSDPYRIAADIPGIGFLKADSIARQLGLPADSQARIQASICYVLENYCAVRGHSFLPEQELVRECLSFLNRESGSVQIASDRVSAAIADLFSAGRLLREETGVYLTRVHEAEAHLAQCLRNLLRRPPAGPAGFGSVLTEVETEAGLRYAPEQREAIRCALTSPVAIVTGGPGTGKSTIIRGVVSAVRRLREGASIRLASPTGRAAKRMAEVTGLEAQTIHRLLEFSPDTGAFSRHEANPVKGDLLVVDEASMMDLDLARALFRAVPPGMRVLLVGDADQLPSVGVGNVFADLIRSRTLPVVRLSQIFRQARESRIVTNAHRVNHGRLPIFDQTSDCQFVAIEEDADVADFIRRAALTYRASGLGLDEINVLSPMKKTETGVAALNRLLQEALNPASPGKRQVAAGESLLREGDKVMQIRNNYAKEVFNGDMGIIEEVRLPKDTEQEDEEEEQERIVVDFQGVRVAYLRTEWGELALAYACTVHKAQGCEYKGVVLIPVVRRHAVMLQRNLLYTAMTRARERVILVGQKAAVWRAVTNVGSRLRYSRLAERLRVEEPRLSTQRV